GSDPGRQAWAVGVEQERTSARRTQHPYDLHPRSSGSHSVRCGRPAIWPENLSPFSSESALDVSDGGSCAIHPCAAVDDNRPGQSLKRSPNQLKLLIRERRTLVVQDGKMFDHEPCFAIVRDESCWKGGVQM